MSAATLGSLVADAWLAAAPDPAVPTGLALAVVGALCFGVGQAVQKRRAMGLPALAERPGRAARAFVRDRTWLAATALLLAGWTFEFLALLFAPIALVLPVNVLSVGVVAALAVRWFDERLKRAEWAGIAACAVGMLLAALSTGVAGESASGGIRMERLGVAVGAAILLASLSWAAAARRAARTEIARASAAGLLFATSAILTKALAIAAVGERDALLSLGLGALLGATALAALFAMQSAFQGGRAVVVVAWAGVLSDFVPALLGAAVFGERWPTGLLGVVRALAVVCFLAGFGLLAGAAARFRSPGASSGAGAAVRPRRPTSAAGR